MKIFFDVRDDGKTVVEFTFVRREGFQWGAELINTYRLSKDGTFWYRSEARIIPFTSRADAVATYEAISKWTPKAHGTSLPSDYVERCIVDSLKRLDLIAYRRSLCA